MTSFENLSSSQKVRAALHRDVINICKETCHFLGLEITKPAMDIIMEILFHKISVYGADLEAFAKHAKRASINCEDVKLLVRRNPSLKALLNNLAPSTTKEKQRKSSSTKQAEASTSKTEEEKQKTENAKKEKEQRDKELREAEEKKLEKILEQTEEMSVDVIDLTL